MNKLTRTVLALGLAVTSLSLGFAAPAGASPPTTGDASLCADQSHSGNSPTVHFPNGGDLGFEVTTCIQYVASSDQYRAEIITDWHDGDSNRPSVPFDHLQVHVELQDFDSPRVTKTCDITDAVNSATGTSGESVCQTSLDAGPSSGFYLTSDGYLHWDINSDGVGYRAPNQLSGSPAMYDSHGKIRHTVATDALAEYENTSRNYEYKSDSDNNHHGSTNCSYYSGVMTSWPTCGHTTDGVAWRGGTDTGDDTYSWCAVFVNYVYKTAGGVDRSGITTYADSLRTYAGSSHWHPAGDGFHPLPGDAIVYHYSNNDGAGKGDHTGIVVSDIKQSDGSYVVTTIEGNSSDKIAKHTSHSDLLGYTGLDYS